MTKSIPPFLCALCALALAACAPRTNVPQVNSDQVDEEGKAQRMLAFRDHVEKLERLYRVAWRIRESNAELCGDKVAHGVGITFLELDDYDKEKREIVREVLGVAWRPTVFLVPPGSPGHRAGIRRGDVVLLVGNTHVGNKKEAYAALKASIEKGGDIPMVVERAGERLTFVFKAVPVCDYPIFMDRSPVINAYADGQRIQVNLGMMRFVSSDDELAGVLGHELAHNTCQHRRDKSMNVALGRLLVDLPVAVLTGVRINAGAQLANSVGSPLFEEEADYVGLYHSSRAGYDMAAVANFWRRMAVDTPAMIDVTTSHPSSNKRFVILEATAQEIERKRALGLPLRPDKKGDPAPPPAQASGADSGKPSGATIILKDARPVDEAEKIPEPAKAAGGSKPIKADVDG